MKLVLFPIHRQGIVVPKDVSVLLIEHMVPWDLMVTTHARLLIGDLAGTKWELIAKRFEDLMLPEMRKYKLHFDAPESLTKGIPFNRVLQLARQAGCVSRSVTVAWQYLSEQTNRAYIDEVYPGYAHDLVMRFIHEFSMYMTVVPKRTTKSTSKLALEAWAEVDRVLKMKG